MAATKMLLKSQRRAKVLLKRVWKFSSVKGSGIRRIGRVIKRMFSVKETEIMITNGPTVVIAISVMIK
jgi:hypothetical protein